MDTKDAQDLMKRIYLDKDTERGVRGTLLRTFEELGELSEAITKGERENIEEEMADVFAWLCSLANLLDIDLTESLLNKYQGACSKCGKLPCTCEQ
ncbi:MAG: MazG nucleotide pyrophosphohydrolase domain-containing protein [Candidatus Thorarchaeota archaeon]